MFRFIFSGKLHPAILQKAVKAASAAISEHERKLMELCTLPVEEALQRLGVTEHGLSDEQVETARKEYGSNILSHRKEAGLVMELLQRCRNPLVIQLLVICVVSLLMGDVRAATVVGAMVLLSVGLAYVQEHRSSKAVEKLKAMVQTDSLVMRDGKEGDIPIAEIVPGDIVILQAGALIPADLRLISAKDFFVSQSSLTGESMPVEKHAAPADATGRGLIELPDACFQGSNVVSGTARGLVVNTGSKTHFGSIAEKLAGQRAQTSFDKGIAGFTWLMIRFMVVMVAIVFLIVAVTKHNWPEALLFALSVAV